jgi:hypothetical protein
MRNTFIKWNSIKKMRNMYKNSTEYETVWNIMSVTLVRPPTIDYCISKKCWNVLVVTFLLFGKTRLKKFQNLSFETVRLPRTIIFVIRPICYLSIWFYIENENYPRTHCHQRNTITKCLVMDRIITRKYVHGFQRQTVF